MISNSDFDVNDLISKEMRMYPNNVLIRMFEDIYYAQGQVLEHDQDRLVCIINELEYRDVSDYS